MKKIIQKYKSIFGEVSYVRSFATALFLLGVGFLLNYYASIYATNKAGSAVPDIVLSIVPAMKVIYLYVYGPVIFWFLTLVFCLIEPKRLSFVVKSVASFFIIRSFFITLTHMGVPAAAYIGDETIPKALQTLNFGGDLFFSGHTGAPFLMALIFSDHKYMRWFFFLASLFFGVVVLLGHYHYSIDVASAFFITYTIFCICKYFFKSDYEILKQKDDLI